MQANEFQRLVKDMPIIEETGSSFSELNIGRIFHIYAKIASDNNFTLEEIMGHYVAKLRKQNPDMTHSGNYHKDKA